MKRYFFLLILFIGCESTQEREAKRAADYEKIINAPPAEAKKQETPAERRENAKFMLAQAGEAESPCAKAMIYEEILASYADVPESKFAKRNLGAIEKNVLGLLSDAKKNFIAAERREPNENHVNTWIETANSLVNGCDAISIKKHAEKQRDYFQAYRLKHYGY